MPVDYHASWNVVSPPFNRCRRSLHKILLYYALSDAPDVQERSAPGSSEWRGNALVRGFFFLEIVPYQ